MKAKLTHNYQRIISECYKSDPELIYKWHILAPTNAITATIHTLMVFRKHADSFKMYELVEKGKFIGYFGVSKVDRKYVDGFFIMPEFRTKDHFDKFFRSVWNTVGPNSIIPVYAKNERACLFLTKNNCSFVKSVTDTANGNAVNIYQLQTCP